MALTTPAARRTIRRLIRHGRPTPTIRRSTHPRRQADVYADVDGVTRAGGSSPAQVLAILRHPGRGSLPHYWSSYRSV